MITNTPQVEAVPPFDEDAERAVLGSLLIDPASIACVRRILNRADFFIDRHKPIYGAICDLDRRRQPIDLLTVRAELARVKWLEKIGGGVYLSVLMDAMPSALNVQGYARIVADLSKRRVMLNHASLLAQAAYAKDFDPIAVAEDLQAISESFRHDGHSEPDRWRAYTLADAYAPRAPLQFVVSGLFTFPSLSIVYSTPGRLKSFLLADLAMSVASGEAWLPALPGEMETARPVIQCPVMWADFDNGTRRTHERFEALARARNLPDSIPLYYYSMPQPWLDASDAAALAEFSDRITARGAQLVIIDNLGVVSGGADENSAEMIQVMANFRGLAEQTGAAIVLIHHQRKGNGFNGRLGETMRGHSSIEAALDLALLIERDDQSNLLNIRSTKTRDVDVPPFSARFTFEHKPDSTELAQARFFGIGVEDTTDDQTVETAILDALTAAHPIKQNRLIEAVKVTLPNIGINRIRILAGCMADSGKIKRTTGIGRSKVYDQP